MFRRFLESIVILLALAPFAAARQVDRPDLTRPRLLRSQVVRTSSRVRAELDGRVIRYEVTETFVNRGTMVGEADYLLPLPKNAAFEELALSINGELVTGETMGADKARAVYEEIVRRLRDPALVEWMGQGLLRTRIFPIQPGEEKRVVVRFHAVAEREGDALRLDWTGAPRTLQSTGGVSFTLAYADDGSLGEAYSPTHTLQPSRENGRRVARVDGATGPLTLLVPVRNRGGAAVSVLAHAPGNEDGYALLTLSPPARTPRATPRDVVFVLDVSGSMSGRKIEQARAAGRQLLQTLTPADRFRMIDFSSDVRTFRDGWTTATGENVDAALTYLDALRANGGTNIQGALEEALALATPAGRLPLVLFLTDGEPTVGETRPEQITRRAAELRGERRLFTFGIGADVNAALLEQLALQGRGTATFVRPEESVERAVGIVADRLTRPIATDVTITVDGARLYSVQPSGPIDLFAGQDLVVLARYSGTRENATITIEGKTPDGPVRWTGHGSLPARSTENAFVARLWAVQRVGYLSAERRRVGASTELDAELRQLGERYGIPTELTSYLVKEPVLQAVATGMPSPPNVRAANAGVTLTDRFEAAKAASEQRGTRSLDEIDHDSRGGERDSVRTVGTRTFRLAGGAWTDTRPLTGARTVSVQAYSAAYFALVQRMPDLGPLFSVGEQVVIHGHAVTIRVAADGVTELAPAALDAIAREW